MSDVTFRLPARPSLEQLRKQAKELLQEYRAGADAATLADAQFALAREYGFESWPKLVHHIEALPAPSHGMSATPPFYTIDWKERTLEARPPLSDRDWDTLCGLMTEHGISGLRGGGQMTDAALARVAALGHVTRLELGDSSRLSDDGVRHLVRMPQLQRLDLGGWSDQITDRGLEVLRHLPALTHVALRWQQAITDAGVAHLAACDRLEAVDLMGTRTGDGAIRALAGKRHLRHLKAGGLVTAAGLPHLHELPMFKTWQGGDIRLGLMQFDADPTYLLLAPAPFTDGGLEQLVGLDGLFALNVDGPQVMSAAGIRPLVELSHLG